MGLLDKVKQNIKETTGRGLSAQEQYQRAYQKGVFVKDYGAAADNFDKAFDRFQEDHNVEMALRSQANSALYTLLVSKDWASLNGVIAILESLEEIERIGSDNEMVRTGPLATELKALQLERQAEQAESTGEKKQAYAQASDLLMTLGTETLSFTDMLGGSGPTDKALLRAYYCGALSDYYAALNEVTISPARAHDYLQKSAVRFRQAGVAEWSSKVEGYMDQVKMKRHCWICGREMQGRNIFYQYYPANTEQYHRKSIEASGDDVGMLDTEGSVALCTVCGSAIEKQADAYAVKRANEIREWVTPLLQNHEESLVNHAQRLQRLESIAHSHN